MIEALTPFHPRTVHFPVALILVGVLVLAVGLLLGRDRWIGCGQASLGLGALGVTVAIVTGLMDQARAPQVPEVAAVLDQHITVAVGLLIAVGMALYWPVRVKGLFAPGAARWVYLILLMLIVVLVGLEGWLGGRLVYHYGVGVR